MQRADERMSGGWKGTEWNGRSRAERGDKVRQGVSFLLTVSPSPSLL